MPETLASTSGVAAETYCGINETATTCEALLDLISGTKACALDADCGQGKGGLCKTVGGTPNRCTIPCDSGEDIIVYTEDPNVLNYRLLLLHQLIYKINIFIDFSNYCRGLFL